MLCLYFHWGSNLSHWQQHVLNARMQCNVIYLCTIKTTWFCYDNYYQTKLGVTIIHCFCLHTASSTHVHCQSHSLILMDLNWLKSGSIYIWWYWAIFNCELQIVVYNEILKILTAAQLSVFTWDRNRSCWWASTLLTSQLMMHHLMSGCLVQCIMTVGKCPIDYLLMITNYPKGSN